MQIYHANPRHSYIIITYDQSSYESEQNRVDYWLKKIKGNSRWRSNEKYL